MRLCLASFLRAYDQFHQDQINSKDTWRNGHAEAKQTL